MVDQLDQITVSTRSGLVVTGFSHRPRYFSLFPGHDDGALPECGWNRWPAFARLDSEPLTALVAGDPHLEPMRPTPILITMKLAYHYLYKKVTSERSSQGTIVEVDLRSLKPCEFPGSVNLDMIVGQQRRLFSHYFGSDVSGYSARKVHPILTKDGKNHLIKKELLQPEVWDDEKDGEWTAPRSRRDNGRLLFMFIQKCFNRHSDIHILMSNKHVSYPENQEPREEEVWT